MIENGEGADLVISTALQAECAETVAVVKEFPHSRLLWQVSWTKVEPPRERQLVYQSRAHANLKAGIERARKIFKLFPIAESSLEEIEQVLFENTCKNFVDPEFPPSDDSLFNQ
jgi:hypothetical protein